MREGRGKRLKEGPEIFSGLIWTGQKSIDLGLADAIGSLESVARDVIKAEDSDSHDPLGTCESLRDLVRGMVGTCPGHERLRGDPGGGRGVHPHDERIVRDIEFRNTAEGPQMFHPFGLDGPDELDDVRVRVG